MAGNSDLSAVATALNTDVQTANNITFNSFSIPGIGLEPSVIGTVSNLGVDKISAPIAGNNGVFVVMVTSENEAPGVNVASEKMRLAQTNSYRVASQVFTTHRNSVEIDDQRSKFY
ncbi:hypothetical protein [uncultured Draconibacterium sp.]|uniref:hypothetical protein n=1 Tax=uncultured Draconibacterium sp. TaxID=1573823 RepID=UPI003217D27A